MALTDNLCLCGHDRILHVLNSGECQKTVPTACQCKAWMRAVENVDAHDAILSPAYYRRFPNNVEPRHLAGHLTFHLGTALAYVARAGFKGSAEEDIRKAIVHLQFELERLGVKP